MFKVVLCYMYFAKIYFFFKILFILERGGGREKERESNADVRERCRSVASPTHPFWGSEMKPRHVP